MSMTLSYSNIQVWRWWLGIAVRQEKRAWKARRRGLEGERGTWINRERDEAMVCVTAAQHAFLNLWDLWKPTDTAFQAAKVQTLLGHLTTALPPDPVAYTHRIDDFRLNRNKIVHHDNLPSDQRRSDAVPLPHYQNRTSASTYEAQYTADYSSDVLDILFDLLLRVLDHPTPTTRNWATASQRNQVVEYQALRPERGAQGSPDA